MRKFLIVLFVDGDLLAEEGEDEPVTKEQIRAYFTEDWSERDAEAAKLKVLEGDAAVAAYEAIAE